MRESPCLLICSIKDEEAQGTWRYRAQYIGQILKERESEKKRKEMRAEEARSHVWKTLATAGKSSLLMVRSYSF